MSNTLKWVSKGQVFLAPSCLLLKFYKQKLKETGHVYMKKGYCGRGVYHGDRLVIDMNFPDVIKRDENSFQIYEVLGGLSYEFTEFLNENLEFDYYRWIMFGVTN